MAFVAFGLSGFCGFRLLVVSVAFDLGGFCVDWLLVACVALVWFLIACFG